MKHIFKYFACLLVAVFSLGQVWAAEESVTLSTGAYNTDRLIEPWKNGDFWEIKY